MNTQELLDKYGELTDPAKVHAPVERALYNLLKGHRTEITGLIEEDPTGHWFHKAFRQIDVTHMAEIDMAIWFLFQDAPIFWEMISVNR